IVAFVCFFLLFLFFLRLVLLFISFTCFRTTAATSRLGALFASAFVLLLVTGKLFGYKRKRHLRHSVHVGKRFSQLVCHDRRKKYAALLHGKKRQVLCVFRIKDEAILHRSHLKKEYRRRRQRLQA